MPSKVPCPSCAAEIQADADHCDQCGADITAPTVRLSADELDAVSSSGAHSSEKAAALAALTADVSATLAPRFQSVRLLGQGGMGLVYLARDPGLKRDVAVKVLAPDEAADANSHRRFIREAQAAAAVAHPNVVTIHQVGELNRSGAPYFVMQYVEGRTLEQEFPRGTPAAEPTARRIVAEIAAALAAAHDRNVVHRDIKPSNIMLDPHSGRAIVVDFGISAAAMRRPESRDTRLTAQGISLGTPRYMSPEQASGEEVGGKSDVYSLGLVAFELLTGRPVFEERNVMALIAAHINAAPPRLAELRPELDPAFADVVQRCLAKQPADRPTAREIAQLLHPAQARIEWPPPGLERLHRKGLDLLRVARLQAAVAIALLALLYLQPAMATGSWAGGETSWFWRVVWAPGFWADGTFLRPMDCNVRESIDLACAPPMVDAGPLWLFAISTLVALQLVGLGMAIRRTRALRSAARHGRRIGYPDRVVSDVAWDVHESAGALLEGVGAFALTTEAERQEFRDRRRRATWLRMLAYTVTALMPVLWVLGIIHVSDSPGRIVALPELLLSITPFLLLAAAHDRVMRPERSLKQRWRRTNYRLATGASTSRALVDGWLDSGQQLLTGEGSRRDAVMSSTMLPAGVALLLAAAGIVLAGSAHFAALWTGPTVRSMQQDLFDSREELVPATWGWLDSAMVDEIKRLERATDRGRVVPSSSRPNAALRIALRGYQNDSIQVDSALARLTHDTAWKWRDDWRDALTWAQWSPRSDIAPERGLPRGTRPRVQSALEAAVLAFEAGDHNTARSRDREALQYARFVMSVLLWSSFQPAADIREALELHAALSAALADTLGVRTSELIRDRFERHLWANRLFLLSPMSLTLASDPENSQLTQLASRSSHSSPGARRQVALVSVLGVCFNSREVLFGPSDARWRLVDEVRAAVADMPVVVRQLDSLKAEVKGAVEQRRGPLRMFTRFGEICDLNRLSRFK